jgi:hypothetical protein
MNETQDHDAKVVRVNQVIARAEDLVGALDETVSELVELLRSYSEQGLVKD